MIKQMNKISFASLTFLLVCLWGASSSQSEFNIASPDGQITATLTFDRKLGSVSYTVQSRNQEIISASAMGISTNSAEFVGGMKLKGRTETTINETYTLPQGKVSTYRNHAIGEWSSSHLKPPRKLWSPISLRI